MSKFPERHERDGWKAIQRYANHITNWIHPLHVTIVGVSRQDIEDAFARIPEIAGHYTVEERYTRERNRCNTHTHSIVDYASGNKRKLTPLIREAIWEATGRRITNIHTQHLIGECGNEERYKNVKRLISYFHKKVSRLGFYPYERRVKASGSLTRPLQTFDNSGSELSDTHHWMSTLQRKAGTYVNRVLSKSPIPDRRRQGGFLRVLQDSFRPPKEE